MCVCIYIQALVDEHLHDRSGSSVNDVQVELNLREKINITLLKDCVECVHPSVLVLSDCVECVHPSVLVLSDCVELTRCLKACRML